MIIFLLLAFLLELFILANLSKVLTNQLARFLRFLVKSEKGMISGLAIVYLPGTIIHELSHMILAGMMLVHVGDIEVFPEVRENEVKLGSAQIGETDPFRRMIIGVAPAIMGLTIITIGAIYLQQNFQTLEIWQKILALYLFFEIGNTMFSSKKDLEGVVTFFIALLIVIVAILVFLYASGMLANVNLIEILNKSFLSNVFIAVNLALLVPLTIDALLILVFKLLKR